jgi:hypothetical protein
MTQNVILTIVRVMMVMSVLALGVLPENNMLHQAKLEPDRIFLYVATLSNSNTDITNKVTPAK